MTATLPETIGHLDFDHEPGCVRTVKLGTPSCGRTPVTHRVAWECHQVGLICRPCAGELFELVARVPDDWGRCGCGEMWKVRDIRVVPL
jgi:hypothetical protein